MTFKVGEALRGTVAPVQEEKAQPAVGIKLRGIRLEHEERGFPSISNCDLQSWADVSIKLIRGRGLSVTPRGRLSPRAFVLEAARRCRYPPSGPCSRAAAGRRVPERSRGCRGARWGMPSRRGGAGGGGGGRAAGCRACLRRAGPPARARLGSAQSSPAAVRRELRPRAALRAAPSPHGEQRGAGGAGAGLNRAAPRGHLLLRAPAPGGAELSGARPCPWCCRRAGGSPAQRGSPAAPAARPPAAACSPAGAAPSILLRQGPQPGGEKQRFLPKEPLPRLRFARGAEQWLHCQGWFVRLRSCCWSGVGASVPSCLQPGSPPNLVLAPCRMLV